MIWSMVYFIPLLQPCNITVACHICDLKSSLYTVIAKIQTIILYHIEHYLLKIGKSDGPRLLTNILMYIYYYCLI